MRSVRVPRRDARRCPLAIQLRIVPAVTFASAAACATVSCSAEGRKLFIQNMVELLRTTSKLVASYANLARWLTVDNFCFVSQQRLTHASHAQRVTHSVATQRDPQTDVTQITCKCSDLNVYVSASFDSSAGSSDTATSGASTPAISALATRDTKLCTDAAAPRLAGNRSSMARVRIGNAIATPKV